MSRIRTIKPEFWGHTKVSRISRDARLLFLGLLNEADDEGRLLGSTKRIAGVVFPHDDDVTPKRIGKWVDELEGVCLILRYEVSGTPYILMPGFTEHQKVSHPTPSRLPSPSGEPPETFAPDLGMDLGMEGKVRQRRPPKNFEPTEAHREFALKHGLELEGERLHWIDDCEAKGRTYEKLNSGFSTWMRNAVNFGRGKSPTQTAWDPDQTSRSGS